MCGRYFVTTPPETLAQIFGFVNQPNFPPRYNIAPSQPISIIRPGRPSQEGLECVLVRWGLIPGWAKEPPKSLLSNARAETVSEKASFKGAVRHRRCLVPADGFYEWQARAPGKGKGPKQPYCIRLRTREPFAMAGIWEDWLGADGSEVDTCAIITTSANETLAPLHHRMPVILTPDLYEPWLDTRETKLADALAMLKPLEEGLLEAYPVSDRVNRVANDDPGLLEPVAPMTEEPDAPASGQFSLF